MKTRSSSSRILPRRNVEQAGSALLIVLILLSVMGALIVSNAVALRRLTVELQLLELKHQRLWQAGPAATPPSSAQPTPPAAAEAGSGESRK